MLQLKNILCQFANRNIFVWLLVTMLSLQSFAQEITTQNKVATDWSTWCGMDMDYQAADNFNLSLAHQVRYDNNMSNFKSYFIEVVGEYKLDDYFNKIRKKRDLDKTKSSLKAGAGYRYVFTNPNEQNGQRVLTWATYKPFIESLENIVDISFRGNFQHDFTWNRQSKRTLLRAKINFGFPLEIKIKTPDPKQKKKKLDLDLNTSYEYFYRLSYQGNTPFRFRWQVGMGLELPNLIIPSPNKRSLSLKYVGQRSLQNVAPQIDHIISFGYGISF